MIKQESPGAPGSDNVPRAPRRRAHFHRVGGLVLLVSVLVLLGATADARRITSATTVQVSPDALPQGDLAGWRQVVAQDFNTPVPLGGFQSSGYAKTLFAYHGFLDTFGHGRYDPNQVLSVSDGRLDWYLHTAGGVNLVSAVVVTVPATRWGQLYGRYTVRYRSDVMLGYKMAFLLWPDNENWGAGEIDFPESPSFRSGATILANLYQRRDNNSDEPGATTGFTTKVDAAGSGWHTATIEWLPKGLTFILDGKVLGTKTAGIPNVPMHWVLQIETSATGPGKDSKVAGHVQVDWATVYAPS